MQRIEKHDNSPFAKGFAQRLVGFVGAIFMKGQCLVDSELLCNRRGVLLPIELNDSQEPVDNIFKQDLDLRYRS